MTIVVVLAVLALGAVFAYGVFRPVLDGWAAEKDYAGDGSGSVTITITPGDTGMAIAQNLERNGVVKTAGAFTDALSSTKGDEIQPGSYTLRRQMSASSALTALRDGSARDVIRVTLREGLWKAEIFAELAKASGRQVADYVAAEKQLSGEPGRLRLPDEAKGNLEGYLFPATYAFDRTSTPVDQLTKMVGTTMTTLADLHVPADQTHRVMTVASLVEAEARHPEDRPKVARVIENRLADRMPLQLDSTSAYGAGVRTKVMTTPAQRAARNDYNTYVISGLPAGPIGNPGKTSIEAALHPAEGPWIFFVTIDPESGETVFSTTTAEHDALVARLNAWCTAHPGKC